MVERREKWYDTKIIMCANGFKRSFQIGVTLEMLVSKGYIFCHKALWGHLCGDWSCPFWESNTDLSPISQSVLHQADSLSTLLGWFVRQYLSLHAWVSRPWNVITRQDSAPSKCLMSKERLDFTCISLSQVSLASLGQTKRKRSYNVENQM